MKQISFLTIIIVVVIACNNSTPSETSNAVKIETAKDTPIQNGETNCFAYVKNRDTVFMQLSIRII